MLHIRNKSKFESGTSSLRRPPLILPERERLQIKQTKVETDTKQNELKNIQQNILNLYTLLSAGILPKKEESKEVVEEEIKDVDIVPIKEPKSTYVKKSVEKPTDKKKIAKDLAQAEADMEIVNDLLSKKQKPAEKLLQKLVKKYSKPLPKRIKDKVKAIKQLDERLESNGDDNDTIREMIVKGNIGI